MHVSQMKNNENINNEITETFEFQPQRRRESSEITYSDPRIGEMNTGLTLGPLIQINCS